MKILITNDQLQILTSQFYLIEGRGLVKDNIDLITESRMKEYLVKVIVNGMLAQIRVGAFNGTSALAVVRNLFPNCRITGAFYSA